MPDVNSASPFESKTCPDCGSPMRIKQSPRGFFLGCTKYPKCRRALTLSAAEQKEIRK